MPDIQRDTVTHLYVKNRGATDGAVEMYYYDVYAMWSGPGSLTLETNVAAAGEYEIALCCSVLVDEVSVDLDIGGRKLNAAAGRTWPLFDNAGDRTYNFERVPLAETVDLPGGPLTITVGTSDALPEKGFNVVSIELTPLAAKDAIAATEKEGCAFKSNTDWFVEAGYGLMFHWTDGAAPRHGELKPYADAARDFDVAAWADAVEDTGAGYVFLTANHGTPHFPAALEYWESVHPGRTTQRDLIAEMADALEPRGIRMMLYLNCPTFGSLGERELDDYFDVNRRMFEEVGTRYGEAVAGYWLDSWYQPYIKYGHFPIERMFEATKAGNPDRLVAFNHWMFPVSTMAQDYWAGEVYQSLVPPPRSRCFEAGAGRGLQYHLLLAMDCQWGHSKPDTEMAPPIWTGDEMAEYIRACIDGQGVVTVNMGIFQDGTLGEKSLEVMRRVRKTIRG